MNWIPTIVQFSVNQFGRCALDTAWSENVAGNYVMTASEREKESEKERERYGLVDRARKRRQPKCCAE